MSCDWIYVNVRHIFVGTNTSSTLGAVIIHFLKYKIKLKCKKETDAVLLLKLLYFLSLPNFTIKLIKKNPYFSLNTTVLNVLVL